MENTSTQKLQKFIWLKSSWPITWLPIHHSMLALPFPDRNCAASTRVDNPPRFKGGVTDRWRKIFLAITANITIVFVLKNTIYTKWIGAGRSFLWPCFIEWHEKHCGWISFVPLVTPCTFYLIKCSLFKLNTFNGFFDFVFHNTSCRAFSSSSSGLHSFLVFIVFFVIF